MNLTRALRAAYDKFLESYDLLLMPTLPMMPTALPGAFEAQELQVQRAFKMTNNTCPFDITHHPTMSICCGRVNGLTVGMMLVGRHFDEMSIYRLANGFEIATDWRDF